MWSIQLVHTNISGEKNNGTDTRRFTTSSAHSSCQQEIFSASEQAAQTTGYPSKAIMSRTHSRDSLCHRLSLWASRTHSICLQSVVVIGATLNTKNTKLSSINNLHSTCAPESVLLAHQSWLQSSQQPCCCSYTAGMLGQPSHSASYPAPCSSCCS